MKRSVLFFGSALLALAGVAGCANQNDPASAASEVGTVQQDQIVTGPMGPLFWPTGPITWANGVGTWPIAFWSPTAVNWLACGIPGATTFNLGLTALDGTAIAGWDGLAGPIGADLVGLYGTGTWLGGFAPYYGAYPGFSGLGTTGFYGWPGYVYGYGYYPWYGAGLTGLNTLTTTPLINGLAFPGLLPAGLAGFDGTLATTFPAAWGGLGWMNPVFDSSLLWFNTLPAFVGNTPFLLNLTFSGITAAQMASVSLFTASAAAATSSLAIQATLFPITGVPLW